MELIYFDLDGTLTDPFEGISKSIIYALNALSAPVPTQTVLQQCIGPPLLDTFSALVDPANAEKALALYRERFADVGWKENVPYDGIHDALALLRASGAKVFVATSKPRIFAEKIVAHFGMSEFFSKVYGSELDGTHTDKTKLLAYALSEETRWRRATMIGDRKHDVIGAINNNIGIVGVSYGCGSVKELRDAGAERIAATPAAIVELVF